MHFKPLLILAQLLSFSCNNNVISGVKEKTNISSAAAQPFTKVMDIPLPAGYVRIEEAGFASFLRHIALKKDRTVYLFNGQPKTNQLAQFAVLDISVGHKDLQQCADAVMRIRAEYLFAAGQFDQVMFKDNNGKVYQFYPPYSKENFGKYLQQVFGMCGSASLSKQLHPVADFASMQPGDVLIRGGFPGHAVIVTDVAVNAAGEKIYLLSQSYMPAQDIHILVNPMEEGLSPWYKLNDERIINTPEYTFTSNELKRW
jgi:hypothetical protein